jgi:YD repeat-containing protein
VCGTGTTTVTYTYDGARRLTKASSSDGKVTTYTNWDVSGRPTSGSLSSGGTVSIVYDTAARTSTITRSSGSGPTSTQLTYDTNGILIMSIDSTGLTTTFNVTGTNQICK